MATEQNNNNARREAAATEVYDALNMIVMTCSALTFAAMTAGDATAKILRNIDRIAEAMQTLDPHRIKTLDR